MDFTKIYKEYSNKVYRICLGFVNDTEKAKDLTQETFISVLQNMDSFQNRASIGTWVYRIATNKCLRLIEIEKKYQTTALPILEENLTEEGNEEQLLFLRNCIAELDEIDRIIITLFMEDVAQVGIAEITGLTHSNVRVKVHRIKEHLLKRFKEDGRF